ncbi:MAG: zinc ribbon domain-containing protein [Candidatus Parcubacteria bacterium]|nr:zinc ribbon domain-containing protein [Candidatus Parcubacteria bacterium]
MDPKIKPNSKCKKCDHEFYVQGFDADQETCPECGSKEVINLHLKNLPDSGRDITPQKLTLGN